MKPKPVGDSYPCLTVEMPFPLHKKLIDPRVLNHLAQFELVFDEEEMMKVLALSVKYGIQNG